MDCLKSGIYLITNTVTNKVYIGQAKDLTKRRKAFFDFSKKYSGSKINTARLDYPDEKYWTYEVILYCEEDDLDRNEILFIHHFDSFNKGYNSTPGGQFKYDVKSARLVNNIVNLLI